MSGWLTAVVPLLSALLGAIVGGWLVHRLALLRDIQSARRDQRVDYLVAAYRRLIKVSNRPGGLSHEQVSEFEDALSDIVLLGEPEEIETSRVIMVDMANGGSATLDPLINALRNSLRKEIGLTESSLPKPYVLRIEDSRVLAPSVPRRITFEPE